MLNHKGSKYTRIARIVVGEEKSRPCARPHRESDTARKFPAPQTSGRRTP